MTCLENIVLVSGHLFSIKRIRNKTTDLYNKTCIDFPCLLLGGFLHGDEGYGHEGMATDGTVDFLLGSPSPHRRLNLRGKFFFGISDDLKASSFLVKEQRLWERLKEGILYI